MIGGPRRGGLVRTMGRTAVVAGTASAVAGGVHHRQSKRWSEKDQAAMDRQQAEYNQAYQQGAADASTPQQAAPEPAPAGMSTDKKIEELKELAQLKDAGVLTEEEFASQKAKILGS